MIVETARDAASLFEAIFAEAPAGAETLAVAYLDGERRLIGTLSEPPAETDGVDLPIRRILEQALRLGASGMVIAHNHPSGDPQPSREDVEATRELAETAARLGIRLVDHLIFAGGETCSLRALGLL